MSVTNQHQEDRKTLPQKNFTEELATLRKTLTKIIEKNMNKAKRLSTKYNWIHVHQAARYITLLSEKELEKILETKPLKTIRTNTLLVTRDRLIKRLEDKGLLVEEYKLTPYGIVIKYTPIPIGALHEYMLGLYTIQGPASMLAVLAQEPEQANRILDMCAGAGIKTTQIAQHNNRAKIIALDINNRKLLALKNNLSRLHVDNVVAINMDAREAPKLGKFDSILLDAPCSGEGLISYPAKTKPRTIDDILTRVHIQLQLLDAALNTARKNATIIYATCSMSFEENEYVIDTLLKKRGDFEVEEPRIPGEPGRTSYDNLRTDPSLARCRRLFPHIHHTEGFTICKLRKT